MSKRVNFPDDQIDPAKKGRDWHLQYLKAIEDDAVSNGNFHERQKEFKAWRKIARGKQDIADYYPSLGVSEEDMRNGESWKKIDWTPLKIAMKFVRVLVNELIGRHTDLIIDLIDEAGVEQMKKKEADVNTYMIHERLLNDMQGIAGIQVPEPLPPGTPKPQTPQETKDILSMYAPNPLVVDMKDKIEKTFRLNNWGEISREIAQDLVEVGLGGTRVRLGNNSHAPKLIPVSPENLLLPKCRYNDYRDAWYIGERIPMTIAQLRKVDTNGDLNELDYYEIAQQTDKESYGNITYQDALNHYNKYNYYQYDDCTVDVIYAEWDSPDTNVFLTRKNRNGNLTVKRKSYDWYDHEKAKDEYKRSFIDREVTLTSWDNIYTGMWIKGTDKVINWGLQESMERHNDDFEKPRKSFKLYTTGGQSFIEEIHPHIDNIMVNWYQMQHHQTQSRPDGLAVEINSLIKAQHVGKGGEAGISWKDNLAMFRSIGTIVFKWIETSGGSTPFPIQELKGGIPTAAKEHFEAVLSQISMISEITGISPTRVAGAVDPKQSKYATQSQDQSSQSAISHLTRGFDKIYEETAQRICHLIGEMTRSKSFGKSANFMKVKKEVGLHLFEVSIDQGLTNYHREILERDIEISLQQQLLLPEEATVIRMQKNLYKAVHMMIRFRREREEKAQQNAQAQSEMQMKQNQASQQQALEEKLQLLQAEGEIKKQEQIADAQSKAEIIKIEKTHELEMKKLEYEYKMKELALKQRYEAAMAQDEHDDDMEMAEYNAAVQLKLADKQKAMQKDKSTSNKKKTQKS